MAIIGLQINASPSPISMMQALKSNVVSIGISTSIFLCLHHCQVLVFHIRDAKILQSCRDEISFQCLFYCIRQSILLIFWEWSESMYDLIRNLMLHKNSA